MTVWLYDEFSEEHLGEMQILLGTQNLWVEIPDNLCDYVSGVAKLVVCGVELPIELFKALKSLIEKDMQ